MSWLRKFAEDLGMAVLDAIARWLEPDGTPLAKRSTSTTRTAWARGPEESKRA